MPPAGLIEMPPVSNTTPLPTKATGFSPGLAAVPLHDRQARRPAGALRDAEQRAHAELAHLLLAEDLDLDAELLQRLGALGELLRPEHVGRLVDEIAGQDDALDHGTRGGKGLPGGGGIAHDDGHLRLLRGLLALVPGFPRLVGVEAVVAEKHAGGEVRGFGGAEIQPGNIEEDGRRFGPLQLRRGDAARRQPVVRLQGIVVAEPEDHDAIGARSLGGEDLVRRLRLAREAGHLAGAGNDAVRVDAGGGRGERPAGPGGNDRHAALRLAGARKSEFD